MFKTLAGASLAALFISSASFANVLGVNEGNETSTTPEMIAPLWFSSVDQDASPVAPAEMFLLFASENQDDALPKAELSLAQAESDDAIPAAEMFSLLLVQANDDDALPKAELSLAQAEGDDAIPAAEMLLSQEEGDALPAERLAQAEGDDAIPTAEMLFFIAQEDGDVLPAERLAQAEGDEVLPMANADDTDALPKAELSLAQAEGDDAIPTAEMLFVVL